MIENDAQPDLPRIGDDLVHNLQAALPSQIGVLREVDSLRNAAGIEQLIGKWQTNGVEAKLLHLVHHVFVIAHAQAIRRELRGFQAKPTHAGQTDGLIAGIENLIAGGVKETRCGSHGRSLRDVDAAHTETRRRRRRCGAVPFQKIAARPDVGSPAPSQESKRDGSTGPDEFVPIERLYHVMRALMADNLRASRCCRSFARSRIRVANR